MEMDYTIGNEEQFDAMDLIESLKAQMKAIDSNILTGADIATFLDLAKV